MSWKLNNRLGNLRGIRDNEPFVRRLAETIAWCAPRPNINDPITSLRYEPWRPRQLEVDRAASVQYVVGQRSMNIDAHLVPGMSSGLDLKGGRLLAYFPDAELSDGAAELETGGYFDVCNTPPWDTWIALFENPRAKDESYRVFLAAWVPSEFIETVDRGVNVNPEESIVWLDTIRTSLTDWVRDAGLL